MRCGCEQPASAAARDRCAGSTCSVVSATSSVESDSETAVQDGVRRRRRNQRTRRIGRRARRDNWLGGQRGNVEDVQKGCRNGQRGRLIALLPVMAVLGAEIGELGVHRPRHVFATRCLPVGRCHRRIGRTAIGRSGRGHLHPHACCGRQPRASVGRNRQLREQHDADERAADGSQKLARHDHNRSATTRPAADAAPPRTARGRSSTMGRLQFMVIGKVPTALADSALTCLKFSRSGADNRTRDCADFVTARPRVEAGGRSTINGSDHRHLLTAALSTADSLH